MGKSSINEPFSMAMLNNQRVYYIVCISLIYCVYPTWNFPNKESDGPSCPKQNCSFWYRGILGHDFFQKAFWGLIARPLELLTFAKTATFAPAIACTTDESNKLQDWEQISNVLWHPRVDLLLYLFSCWWWLEHGWMIFPFSWECHHPNWLSHFFGGVGIPPTSFVFVVVAWVMIFSRLSDPGILAISAGQGGCFCPKNQVSMWAGKIPRRIICLVVLSFYLSIYLLYLPIYLFMYISISIYRSIYLFIYWYIYLSIFLHYHMCIDLYMWTFTYLCFSACLFYTYKCEIYTCRYTHTYIYIYAYLFI